MWTTSISLPAEDNPAQNESGFVTHNKSWEGGIPANMMDATRQEEVLANQRGYNADVVVEIDAEAYNGAGHFMDEATGDEYDIVRRYQKDKSNRIRLTGQRREHGRL